MAGAAMKSRLNSFQPLHLIDSLSRWMGTVAGVLLLMMLLHIVADVLARTLSNSPLPGTLAFITYWWMPTIVFLSLGTAELARDHIRVSLLVDRMTPTPARVVNSVASFLAIASVAIILYYGILQAIGSTFVQRAVVGTIDVPVWIAEVGMTVGLLVFLLQLSANLWREWSTKTSSGSTLSEQEYTMKEGQVGE